MTALLENWRIALAALGANWFRALLTALGIVAALGSLAVIALTVVVGHLGSEAAWAERIAGTSVTKTPTESPSPSPTGTATPSSTATPSGTTSPDDDATRTPSPSGTSDDATRTPTAHPSATRTSGA